MGCNDRLGWYYHKAADHTQKYKEGTKKSPFVILRSLTIPHPQGKYLLEREKIMKENNWKLDD
jgi:hypothetical protein